MNGFALIAVMTTLESHQRFRHPFLILIDTDEHAADLEHGRHSPHVGYIAPCNVLICY